MRIEDVFRPAVVLSQSHAPVSGKPGAMAGAIERLGREGFFRAAEFGRIADRGERAAIAAVARERDMTLTQWTADVLFYVGAELSPAAIDQSVRRRAMDAFFRLLDEAAESGVSFMGICSGSDPGLELRKQATETLVASLREACDAAAARAMGVVLEPLDRRAHKKCLIGPAVEAAALAAEVRVSFPNLSLCWDSAHMLLEGEDLASSLETMSPFLTHLHLANPVLDPARRDFGDHHARFNPGADMSVGMGGLILRRAAAIASAAGQRWLLAAEVRTPEAGDPWDTVAHCAAVLREAWAAAEAGAPRTV